MSDPAEPHLSELLTALRLVSDTKLVAVQSFGRELADKSTPQVGRLFEIVARLAALEHARRVELLQTVERDMASDRTTTSWGSADYGPPQAGSA